MMPECYEESLFALASNKKYACASSLTPILNLQNKPLCLLSAHEFYSF